MAAPFAARPAPWRATANRALTTKPYLPTALGTPFPPMPRGSDARLQRSTDPTHAGPPPPMPQEVWRAHVVGRLAARWRHPVTVVIAGPGFGKTTALAQAVRSHAAAPVGVEAWVSCAAGHEDAGRLAADIVVALHGVPGTGDPLGDVLATMRAHAPVQVSVVLDDVHVIPDDSSAGAFLADLVRRLPAHAHLVLAGQRPPPTPLAHLRCRGLVHEIAEHDLVFTATEQARLADVLGCAPIDDRFHGWPALVRLALAASPAASTEYAREEVLARLTSCDRRALYALAVVGCGDHQLVARMVDTPVDLARLAAQVPLVSPAGPGAFRAHELWLAPAAASLDPAEARAMPARAVAELAARGDLVRAGWLAARHGDWEALARVGLALVRSTLSVLPVDTARGWLHLVPADQRETPELAVLEAAACATEDFTDPRIDGLLDRAAAEFGRRADPDGEVVALALGTVVAPSRGDVARIVGLAARAHAVPGADRHPVVRLAARGIRAAMAEMAGDPEAALDALAGAPLDEVPPPLATAAQRLRVHCLLLAGRADEAVVEAERHLATGGNGHSRLMPAFARWQAGDPSGYLAPAREDEPELAAPPPGTSARDAFVGDLFQAVIAASWGVASGRARIATALTSDRWDSSRDAALLTNALAAQRLLAHDEEAARAAFADLLGRHPITDALAVRHLRRFLALGYVLHPELRARWDADALGPAHERVRTVARTLLDARRGRRTAGPLDPALVFTALPLPWAVELACRRHALGADDGAALASWLVDAVGPAARAELRHLAGSPSTPPEGRDTSARISPESDPTVARAAARLLASLPVEPSETLTIGVLGPLELRRGGRRVDRPELRRYRVRELLAVLVAEGEVRRDRAIDLLWPELDAEAGGRNLRVTLAHLRRLLEPDRPAREAPFFLRADASIIRLFPSSRLTVDLWELRRLVAEAGVARRQGAIDKAVAHLDAATALWRGTPLADLDRLPGFDADIAGARLTQLDALMALGELQLSAGDAGRAGMAAERAITLDPYLEGAHRLAIAAAVAGRDPQRTEAGVRRVRAMLAELGVDPEPATLMLLRQAGAPLGARAGRAA